jgi:uncharacterized protein (DUF2384 family)
MSGLFVLGEAIDRLTASFGITESQFASVLGVQARTVERWKAESSFPQHESRRRFEALVALADELDRSFASSEGARSWLHSESGYFGGLEPIDALLRGRIDLVDAALEAMHAGTFV